MYGKQSLFIVLCSSSISYLPHIHQLIYQADDNSDADTNDPPNQPNDESVVGLKQPPELLTQVEVPCQPDNHDSIQELVDAAQKLMISNEYVFNFILCTLYHLYHLMHNFIIRPQHRPPNHHYLLLLLLQKKSTQTLLLLS